MHSVSRIRMASAQKDLLTKITVHQYVSWRLSRPQRHRGYVFTHSLSFWCFLTWAAFFIAATRYRMRATRGLCCLRIAYVLEQAAQDVSTAEREEQIKKKRDICILHTAHCDQRKEITPRLSLALCVTRNHPEMKCIFNDIQFTVIAAALPQWHQWYDDRRS